MENNNKKNQIVETARSFVLAHPFLTYFIADGIISIFKVAAQEIGKSRRYDSYIKGYHVFADRLADLRSLEQPTKPWDFEVKKQEKEENEEKENNEEKDTTDGNDDSDVSDIFSDGTGNADRGDDDLHG